MNARVIAVDLNAERPQRAREFGADTLIDPAKTDALEALRELTRGVGVDCVLETSGASSARIAAVRGHQDLGRLLFRRRSRRRHDNVSPDMIRRQMTIIASWTCSTVGQADCAKFIAERGINVDGIYTGRWSRGQAAEAYRLFDQGICGKGVFLM